MSGRSSPAVEHGLDQLDPAAGADDGRRATRTGPTGTGAEDVVGQPHGLPAVDAAGPLGLAQQQGGRRPGVLQPGSHGPMVSAVAS